MAQNPERRQFNVCDIWGRLGITEHLGGYRATRRLAEMCGVRPGHLVLDIGCGTGFSACFLAKECGASVVAADLRPDVLAWARNRIAKEGVGDKVVALLADAQNLPFKANTFDVVLSESVLVFTDQTRSASEVLRVLKPGGVFGDNEVTWLQRPPDELSGLFSRSTLGVDVRFLTEAEWRAVYQKAGFAEISSSIGRLSVWDQLLSHLRVDGVRRYLQAFVESFLDPAIRAEILDKGLLSAALKSFNYLGYGLYVCKKS